MITITKILDNDINSSIFRFKVAHMDISWWRIYGVTIEQLNGKLFIMRDTSDVLIA